MTPEQHANFRDLEQLMKIALQDMLSTVKDSGLGVSKVTGPLPEEHQQAARRFVREAFAAVEAIAFVAKNSAAQLAADSHIEMSPAEIAFARDLEYSVDEKGVVRSSPAKIKMKRNILFGIKLLSRFSNRDFDPQVDWWAQLNSAADVRDRLTHPKRAADMVVTAEEIKQVMGGCWGYSECLRELSAPMLQQ